jgi:ABC-type polysaccharide/polyol phosphate transport system ATPase subunit
LESGRAGETNVVALDDVSLDYADGDRVAILGNNGAGKSTLLKTIASVYKPVSGRMDIRGSVSSMFNVRLGMDPLISGYENIFLRGLAMGLTKSDIQRKIEDIDKFSELGSYLAMPVRTYSQGMIMRLALAIATAVEPDILLLDEWVGAGDASFLEKTQHRMEALIGRSKILIFASHRLDLVKKFCNKAALLEHGKVIANGPSDQIISGLGRS